MSIATRHYKLSPREVEILQLTANGRSTQEICNQLYICEATLKTHKRNIYCKVGNNSIAYCVAESFRLSLIK